MDHNLNNKRLYGHFGNTCYTYKKYIFIASNKSYAKNYLLISLETNYTFLKKKGKRVVFNYDLGSINQQIRSTHRGITSVLI